MKSTWLTFLFMELDYNKIRAGNNDFLDNKQLQNILFSLHGTYAYQVQASEKGIKSCKTLLEALDK